MIVTHIATFLLYVCYPPIGSRYPGVEVGDLNSLVVVLAASLNLWRGIDLRIK